MAKKKAFPEVEIELCSVKVTPKTCDDIACQLVRDHGPDSIRLRATMDIFSPAPYIRADSTRKDLAKPPKKHLWPDQRSAIIYGGVRKLFYITAKEIKNG